jgi:thymidylate synthase (FAD)
MNCYLEVVEPHVEFITPKHNPYWDKQALSLIEECGRVSHKSEARAKPGTAEPFIRKVAIHWGHESIIEHSNFTVCFIGSRAMSHQLVRHRIASYTQESQRYCDYSPDTDNVLKTLKVIIPPSITTLPQGTIISGDTGDPEVIATPPNKESISYRLDTAIGSYLNSLLQAYKTYCNLIELKIPGEDARYLLPNATKTEVYTTFNLRNWRWFFTMRLDKHAQWEIRQCAQQAFRYFQNNLPIITENLKTHSGDQL